MSKIRLNKILILWSIVIAFIILTIMGVSYLYMVTFNKEQETAIKEAKVANDAFVEHSIQVLRYTDMLLLTVREYYRLANSIEKTENFIASLNFDPNLVENIYILNDEGFVITPRKDVIKGQVGTKRDYFVYHKISSGDNLHIGNVNKGQVTGLYQFRLTRKITSEDGSFKGVILIPLEPKAFSAYYKKLLTGSEAVASLIGINDHKLRARTPNPPDEAWDKQIGQDIWNHLEESPEGIYSSRSGVDNINRTFVYGKIKNFPLVMVTGISDTDITYAAIRQIKFPTIIIMFIVIFIVMLATIITIIIRKRDEQERLMSMLSHELKTPLSVIRIVLGFQSPGEANKRKALQAIEEINGIIDCCLNVDKLSNNQLHVTPETININELIKELIATAQETSKIDIELSELPSCQTDRKILTIILKNIIENALKYGDQDRNIKIKACNNRENNIIIQICNAPGYVGFPDQKQLFKKYYRSSKAHRKTGSGLGLFIAFNFAKLLGCSLRYIPQEQEICFELKVPI